MAEESVAYQALNLAKQTARDIESHEDICAERYAGIHKAVDEIKGTLKWAGTSMFGIILTMLGFLVVQQLNSNAAIRDGSAAEINTLKQKLAEAQSNRVIQVHPPKEQYADAPAGN